MKNISMTYWYGNESDIKSRVKYLKNAGFKYISLHWCDDYESSNGKKEDIYNYIKQNGMIINVFHLPFEESDYIWSNNEKGDELLSKYLKAINDASYLNVKNIVIHLTEKKDDLENYSFGVKRIKKMLEEANKKDIKIAFENLHHYDALDIVKIFSEYKNFGLCYDTGHFNIRYSSEIVENIDKINVVHLHNNYGIKDTHNLFSEGNSKWDLLKKLIKDPNVVFVLEIKNNHNIKEEDFLKQAKKEYEELIKELENEI